MKTYEECIVGRKNWTTRRDDEMRFLSKSFHISLLRNNEEFLQNLDALSFTYLHVDFFYTLFKYRFTGNTVVTNKQVSDKLLRVVFLIKEIEGRTECSASRKKNSWGKITEST